MKKSEYSYYNELTKEILDGIKVGDFVKCNHWKKPMIVVAVSKNYFIMVAKHFKTFTYSICEKLPSKFTHNMYDEGCFRIGADNYYCYYDYCKLKNCEEALIRLEDGYNYTSLAEKNQHPNWYDWEKTANPITKELGHLELSRKAVNLLSIAVKKTKWNKDNIQEYLDFHFGNKEKADD